MCAKTIDCCSATQSLSAANIQLESSCGRYFQPIVYSPTTIQPDSQHTRGRLPSLTNTLERAPLLLLIANSHSNGRSVINEPQTMNRTQRLNIGSVLELGRLSLKKSAPIECTTGGGDGAGFDDGDYLAPLTASPPASPATRLGGSSASFFPNTTSGAFQHKSTNSLQQVRSSPKNLNRNGSFAVHNLPKLRESKWFTEEDARIFCVVVEIGFIVEIRRKVELVSVTAADTDNNNNTREYKSLFGVVTRKECINQSAEGDCHSIILCIL